MSAVTSRDIEYTAAGIAMVGRLALPSGDGKRPGVLISHEGGGLGDYEKDLAVRLAELGYVAFALDYYGGGKPLPFDQMGERFSALARDNALIRTIAYAGLEVLTSEARTDTNKLAAIGYCFGGTMSLELARSGADIKAVVGFHSGLSTSRPQDAVNITGSVLVCIGTEDPFVPPAQRTAFEEEMRAGGVDWRMNLYGGVEHSFTRPGAEDNGMAGLRYHEPTDRRSWRAMLDLFDEKFA
ncbi:MAG: dienelactone hydrolase family protein [Acidimicrobiia bacterium]